jgi:hypothetical protein
MGVAAQASVPAVYAWGVTVAPVAWARNATGFAKAGAVAALVAIVAGVAAERRWGERARVAALWAFVLSSALTWSAAPSALGTLRVDGPRGTAGMLGWALFAIASAAPALGPREGGEGLGEESSLPARKAPARGDALYVAGGAVVAGVLQFVGWGVGSPERALLIRAVALAAGIAIVGVATSLATARYLARPRASRGQRLRRAMASLVALALLCASGAFLAFRD